MLHDPGGMHGASSLVCINDEVEPIPKFSKVSSVLNQLTSASNLLGGSKVISPILAILWCLNGRLMCFSLNSGQMFSANRSYLLLLQVMIYPLVDIYI